MQEAYEIIPKKWSKLDGAWKLLVSDPITALEIMRRRWGPTKKHIIWELTSRGIPFNTLALAPDNLIIPSHAKANYLRQPFQRTYSDPSQLPTPRDAFRRWQHGLVQLFQTPSKLRAALMKGGIVWRIALDWMTAFDVLDVLRGPSEDGWRIWMSTSDYIWFDDDLTEQELDIICGASVVESTGKYFFPITSVLN